MRNVVNKLCLSFVLSLWTILVLIVLPWQAYGASQFNYSGDETIEASIAAGELNRIGVLGGEIVEVIGDENKYAIYWSSDWRNLFIKPKVEVGETISLSLIMPGGFTQDVMHNIRQGRATVSGANGREQLDRFTNQHQDKISNNPDYAIKEYAEQQGMNVGGFKKQLQDQGDSLKKKHENIRENNLERYAQVRSETESKEQKATQQVEKYEEDRIGKGIIASTGAKTLDFITVGRTGGSVGKPDDKK